MMAVADRDGSGQEEMEVAREDGYRQEGRWEWQGKMAIAKRRYLLLGGMAVAKSRWVWLGGRGVDVAKRMGGLRGKG